MTLFDVGRVCVKVAGRKAGKECVVVDVVDKTYVTIVGHGVKRKRCNVQHLQATPRTLEIKKGADDKAILATL